MSHIKNASDATFQQDVVERSREVPVVVDLWAPWCGPCRALTPVLEKVAEDNGGKFELVKINIDDNPQVAAQLGARSIPLVIAFKNGEVAGNFVGAQPEGKVRAFVSELVPSEADEMCRDAAQALEQDRAGDAVTILQAALRLDDKHRQARMMLAHALAETGDRAGALQVLSDAESTPELEQLRASIKLASSGDEDREALIEASDGGDLEATAKLANALLSDPSAGPIEALGILLKAIETHPEARDSVVKETMLDIFKALGAQDPVVREFRSKLARALY